MELLAIINLIVTVSGLGTLGWLYYPRRAQTRTALPSADGGHTLKRVWENMIVAHERKGWWLECSCGLSCPSNATGRTSYGNERAAIATFKEHAELHRGLGTSAVNPFEKKYNDEVAAFIAYREACYCKDTNDDLLVLKHRHP